MHVNILEKWTYIHVDTNDGSYTHEHLQYFFTADESLFWVIF